MQAHALLYENHQDAYRCHHSKESALIKVYNDLLGALDNGCGVFLVLLDLSAAFDTMDILLDRLDSLGVVRRSPPVDGLILVWQVKTVVIDGVKSDPQYLQYGIPQGSVLGPILFTIHTIPISAIKRLYNLEIHIYADDTRLYVFIKMKDPISQ